MFEDSDTAKLIRILISIIHSYGYYILDSSCGPNFLQQMNMKSAKKSRKVDVEKNVKRPGMLQSMRSQSQTE